MSKSPIPYIEKLVDFSFISGINLSNITEDQTKNYSPEPLLSYPPKNPDDLSGMLEVIISFD